MKENKKALTYIVFIIVGAIVLVGFLYSKNIYKIIKGNIEAKQLEKLYGIPFEMKLIDTSRYYYLYSSNENVYATVDSNWYGKIFSDDYSNYIYSKDVVDYIEEEIGSCFDDCIIIVDCHRRPQFPINTIKSFDEYLNAYKGLDSKYKILKYVTIDIFIRENEDLSHVLEAKEKLENSEMNCFDGFEYYAIRDVVFDALKENGIYTYYDYGAVYDKMYDTLGEDNISSFSNMSYYRVKTSEIEQ